MTLDKQKAPDICTRCRREPVSEGHKNCDKCREYFKSYRKANSERLAKIIKQWVKDNPERVKEHNLKWHKKNPNYNSEQRSKYRIANPDSDRKYREANKEKLLENTRRWTHKHPEVYRAKCHKRRAHMIGNGGHYTPDEEMELFTWQEGRCHYCGDFLYTFYKQERTPYTIEHKTPISRGGSNDISNIALACADCNSEKGILTEEEYRAIINSRKDI